MGIVHTDLHIWVCQKLAEKMCYEKVIRRVHRHLQQNNLTLQFHLVVSVWTFPPTWPLTVLGAAIVTQNSPLQPQSSLATLCCAASSHPLLCFILSAMLQAVLMLRISPGGGDQRSLSDSHVGRAANSSSSRLRSLVATLSRPFPGVLCTPELG